MQRFYLADGLYPSAGWFIPPRKAEILIKLKGSARKGNGKMHSIKLSRIDS
jgi:hypothetical protein